MVVVAGMLWAGLSGWGIQGGDDGRVVGGIPGWVLSWDADRGLLPVGVDAPVEEVDGDVVRLLAYGADWREPGIRVAGKNVVVTLANQAQDPAMGQEYDASLSEDTLEAIDERFTADLSFYSCVGDSTGAYCPGTSRTATGTIPRPGVAACDPGRLGQVLDVGGVILRCEDTGSAIYGNRIDRWFYYAEDGWAWLAEVGTQAVVEVLGGTP